ncbi:hypothetical protein [Cerasicoccus arenae]|uniref:DUF4397 domain-containing protein n=1 Tax=Cerasicoccus arenae TaxID=424488 RepID=A0A8J3GCC8_9BACT|nr:hypothetical protein [Cerasicoccus arenae]MBK1859850.1 hypothetical protein [Cerasicoccus arenae]GHB93418.1 hypothetical protein GCM10007047_06080 [Cerasicoccus arenae]
MLRVFIIALCLQGIFAAKLFAQPTPETIRVTFSCISWNKPIGGNLYVNAGEGMEPVSIHTMQRSKPIEYEGPNPIVFYREPSDKADGMAYVPVARVTVKPGIHEPLFLFFGSGDEYKIFEIEDSFDTFPVGSYRFLNLTNRNMLAQLGSNKLELNSRSLEKLMNPFESTHEYQVAFIVREKDELTPAYYNRWMHFDNYRYLILISESKSQDAGPMEFRILSDMNLNQ